MDELEDIKGEEFEREVRNALRKRIATLREKHRWIVKHGMDNVCEICGNREHYNCAECDVKNCANCYKWCCEKTH